MMETTAGVAAEPLTLEQDDHDSLQAHFQAGVSADEIEQVFHLKRAQPTLQAFTALFHGGADGVLVRLLVSADGVPSGVKAETAGEQAELGRQAVEYIQSCKFAVDPALKGERTDTTFGRVLFKAG